MIKRAWQIWTIYTLCVLLVAPAMVWLTRTTWHLDEARERDRRATEDACLQAETQERVSSALWRMDWLMIPLVAQEAARPHYMYRSFYSAVSGANETAESLAANPSPILTQPSDFILLHFQIEPDNRVASPQSPEEETFKSAALMCGVSESTLAVNQSRLNELKGCCSYETLSAACPTEKLPAADAIVFPWQAAELGAQVSKNMTAPKREALSNMADEIADQLSQVEQDSAGQSAPPQTASPIDELQKFRISQRGSQEYIQRDKATQSFAQSQININRFAPPAESDRSARIFEGVMRPFWIGDMLLMARRVDLGDRVVVQGCWLNWEKIRQALVNEVSEVIPAVKLQPIRKSEVSTAGRQMATLPVQLVDVEGSLARVGLAPLIPTGGPISGLKLSLAVAWVGLILGLAAIAVLLRGVIRLSERRAAFASAVTHELRTPLTTFRMYAEMLAEGMVPSTEKQRQYARTMKLEADRLGHLVENVLRFARLERRTVATRAVKTTIAALFERFESRLLERVSQAGMKFSSEIDDATRQSIMSTDPGTVEQIVFNLVDNACKYAASAPDKTIHLHVAGTLGQALSPKPHAFFAITVRDHGPGINARMSKRLFSAFSKSDQDAAETARGVGLGLALCRRMAADLGGRLVWDKSYTDGASFTLTLPASTDGAV